MGVLPAWTAPNPFHRPIRKPYYQAASWAAVQATIGTWQVLTCLATVLSSPATAGAHCGRRGRRCSQDGRRAP